MLAARCHSTVTSASIGNIPANGVRHTKGIRRAYEGYTKGILRARACKMCGIRYGLTAACTPRSPHSKSYLVGRRQDGIQGFLRVLGSMAP